MSIGRILALVLLSASLPAFAQTRPATAPAAGATATGNGTVDGEGRLRVQISAQQQTSLSAELPAKISSLPLHEGDSFTAGQTLVAFDCAIFRAQLNKAQAQVESARQTLTVSSRLAELNSISNLEVEQAKSKVKETAAEVGAMQATVSKCSLAAPFSGRVAKLYVEPYEYVSQGKPLLDIVNTRRLELKLLVPSRWLAWVAKGTRFSVHVDDLNRDYTARVTRLGARIDPVNQSVMLAGEIDGTPAELLPGMSGWADFKPPK